MPAHWRACPPQQGDMAQWDAQLPDFIVGAADLANEHYLADMARLDWAVHRAEQAADSPAEVAGLGRLGTDGSALLWLRLAPGTAVLASAHPVATLWPARRSADAHRLAPVRKALACAGGEHALVWRQGLHAQVRVLPGADADFTQALLAGQPLGQALYGAAASFAFDDWLLSALRQAPIGRDTLQLVKFLVVDDHPMLREGMAAVLRQFDAGATVLQASDGERGLALAAEHPDLAAVWVDLRMAGLAGIATVEQLRRRRPALPVIVLSSSEDPDDVRRALQAGASGYCPKSAGPATLQAALRLVLAGEIYVPPFMAQLPPEAAEPLHASGLTSRQLEVLQLLCKGHANKDIGRLLGMQEKTVKGHVSAIFRALKVVHRLQAVEAARTAGITGC